MKKLHLSMTAGVLSVCLLCGCSQTAQVADAVTQSASDATTANAVELVADIQTTQYFTDAAVDEADIETILMAGINAPSAMNGQPWHFSVITDTTVLEQISEDMSGGMGFGGKTPGNGAPMSGGTLPEGMEASTDMERSEPAVTELPEGAEGMERPEGMNRPANLPEGTGAMPVDGSTNSMEDMERHEGFAPEGKEGEAPMSLPAGVSGGAGSGGMSKAGLTDAPLAIVISCAEGSKLDAGLACQNMSVAAQLLGYGTKIISSPTIALNGEKQDEYRELLGIPEDQTAVAVLLVGYEDTSVDETADGYTGATPRNPMDEMVTYVVQTAE